MTVPKLDLAPKLTRPLSLWNPLDYLRLLYWCFFFPQALRWYVETFSTVKYDPLRDETNPRQLWQTLRADKVQRDLAIKGLILTIVTPVFISWLIQTGCVPIDWGGVLLGVLLGVLGGMLFSMLFGVLFGVLFSVLFGVVVSMLVGMLVSLLGSISFAVLFGILFGVLGGVSRGTVGSVLDGYSGIGTAGILGGVQFGITSGVLLGIFISILGIFEGIIKINLLFGFILGFRGFFVFELTFWLILFLSHSRWLEYAIMGWLQAWAWRQKKYWILSRVTWLPLPYIQTEVYQWLQEDKMTGISNIIELTTYSCQTIPVLKAVQAWLVTLSEIQLIMTIDKLVQKKVYWEIIRYNSADLAKDLHQSPIFFLFLGSSMHNFTIHKLGEPQLDTPVWATCAGYWCWHAGRLTQAQTAFEQVRHLRYGEGLYQSAVILHEAARCETVEQIATWGQHGAFQALSQAEILRPEAVATLRKLQQVAMETVVALESVSRVGRSTAMNRAIGGLSQLLEQGAQTCPDPEWPIVKKIATQWLPLLTQAAGGIGKQVILQPVDNPFVAGNPVTGRLFVGREEIMGELEELWGNDVAQNVNSVVLFGHRRMGKTSILQNLGAHRFGLKTLVVFSTMQRAGRLQDTGELLAQWAWSIYTTVRAQGLPLAEPNPDRLSYNSFNIFLQQVKQVLWPEYRLILALDEFEKLEDKIQAGQIDVEVIEVLRGVMHSESWLILALAGLHTLDEMVRDYWHPLYASVSPIRVSFLSWRATAQLLGEPHEDFPLDFTRDTIDTIYDLVRGQPFLTQLIGHSLVRRYNQERFETGQERANFFTPAEVHAVVSEETFYLTGSYYFDGLWSQALRPPEGQIAVMRALALSDTPLSQAELHTTAEVLAVLQKHDVIQPVGEAKYDFTVPLLRRWLREFRKK